MGGKWKDLREKKLGENEKTVFKLWRKVLSMCPFKVLGDFSYKTWIKKLHKSTLRKHLREGASLKHLLKMPVGTMRCTVSYM